MPPYLPLLVLLLALSLCYMYASKSAASSASSALPFEEGFQQTHPFLFKRDNDVYDSFYAEIYDTLHVPTTALLDLVLDSSGLLGGRRRPGLDREEEYVTFLEIGAGTGFHMNALFQKGIKVYGVDISKHMNDYSIQKYPHLRPFVQTADATAPMAYESNTFSHILCLNRTVYHFEHKRDLLSNCFHWLQSNGRLALQLVDPANFDPIVPLAKHKCLGACRDTDNVQVMTKMLHEDRVRESEIRFGKMHYRGSWTDNNRNHDHDQPSSSSSSSANLAEIFTEHFVDDTSGHVRQHELTMHFESVDAILLLAKKCGFIVHSLTAAPDSSDSLLILEKPHACM